MRARPDDTFVVLGSDRDKKDFSDLRGVNVINMLGRTELKDAIYALNESRFVVAVDNGLAHIASALDKFTFALFGSTSEAKNRPMGRRSIVISLNVRCRPCQMTPLWHTCLEYLCMSELSADFVWSEIQREGL